MKLTQIQIYKKWKDGINYETNRKIKIGGKKHSELKGKFMISNSHKCNYENKTVECITGGSSQYVSQTGFW
jgi:hypothetical protein